MLMIHNDSFGRNKVRINRSVVVKRASQYYINRNCELLCVITIYVDDFFFFSEGNGRNKCVDVITNDWR